MLWTCILIETFVFFLSVFFSFFSRFGKRGFLITFASLLLGHFITTAVILGHYNLDPLLMGGGENP